MENISKMAQFSTKNLAYVPSLIGIILLELAYAISILQMPFIFPKLTLYFRFFNWAVRQNPVRRATVPYQKFWAIFTKVNRANWTRIIAIISGLKIIYQRKPISLNIIRWVIIMNHQLLEIQLIILNSISIWRNTNNITEQNYSYIQNKWRTSSMFSSSGNTILGSRWLGRLVRCFPG